MRPLLLTLLALSASCRYYAEIDGPDLDRDGYGVEVDCDDNDAAIHPGAQEIPYNGIDDDCDPMTPDDDLDGDGFGVADDCDDTDPSVNPDALEICNGRDDDCDDIVDNALNGLWYLDADGDGFGDEETATETCAPGEGYVALAGDCDDDDDTIHPAATEDCSAVDRNCDTFTDRGVPPSVEGAAIYYADRDGDTWGDASDALSACSTPEGYVSRAGDCDDDPTTGPDVNPDATEACNGRDDDCNGAIDDGAGDLTPFFLDQDGDTYGSVASFVLACAAPPHYVDNAADCDDLDPLSYPGAPEICDGKDNDCNDVPDDAPVDPKTWHPDLDGDGFGDANATPVSACFAPLNHVANALDCLDVPGDGALAFPGNIEVCDDAIDNDCDGVVDNAFDASIWYRDADEDGYGARDTFAWACAAPDGFVDNAEDCDDDPTTGPDVHPDAVEVCNQRDDDCNGVVDDVDFEDPDATGATVYYLDRDGDGQGDLDAPLAACGAAPTNHVANADDCNDFDDTVFDGATPRCDGRDNDCDGLVDYDADGDGWPNATDCAAFPEFVDCDDADDTIYPGRGGCTGGASCLELLALWDAWEIDPIDEGQSNVQKTYTIDGESAGTREVVCDLVGEEGRAGGGWTQVYAQDFNTAGDGVDGWQLSRRTDLGAAVAATRSTSCGSGGMLGPVAAHVDSSNSLGAFFRNISTLGVPHERIHVALDYLFVDDWESTDIAWVQVEDRIIWDGRFSSSNTSSGDGDLCGNIFRNDRGELWAYPRRTLLHTDRATTPSVRVIAGADGNETDEGFGIDNVSVWVK